MTQDKIIEMARQAGFDEHHAKFDTRIKVFAKLVAAAEQEAIIDLVAMYGGPVDLEAAIRARGES